MRLKTILSKMTGNSYAQKCLERNVRVSQYLMGIGSGIEVVSSGEKTMFGVLRQQFSPPYCIFDVGSNKGQFLQLVLENIERDLLSIHCFEPGHDAFKALAAFSGRVKEINGSRLNNIGVSKEPGTAVLHFDQVGSVLASLTKRKLDHIGIEFEKTEQVEITTIDQYCRENNVDHIHLLKIDVEGHEFDVITGAKEMFESSSIDMVSFEFGGTNIDTRTFFRDFWYLLTKYKLRIFRITPSGYLSPIDAYTEFVEQFGATNFVAIANNRQSHSGGKRTAKSDAV
jgi:FkbM family methyltransferase